MKMIRIVTVAVLLLVAGCSTTAYSGRREFLGSWSTDAPGEGGLDIQVARDGRCVITEDGRTWNGTWRSEGRKVIIRMGDETVTFWRTAPDTLTARDDSGEPVSLRKAE
jgi:hypothetical protein